MPETFEQYTARMLALAEGIEPLPALAAAPARLGSLLAGVPADVLLRSPGPDRWSIAEIVSHLADSEIVLAYRARMILSAPGTPIEAFDQNAWCASQRAGASDAFASLALFAAVREGNVRLFAGLAHEERERYGMHAERGRESIAQLMRLEVGHDRNHVEQIERLLAASASREATAFAREPIKPIIEAVVLDQLDVRTGTIRSATPIDGADRLARLVVSFGDRERTIVAGIRTERPSLDAVVGRQALFVVNLPPRKIRGQVSEGMLFDIGFADGLRPAFAVPEWPVPDGVRAG